MNKEKITSGLGGFFRHNLWLLFVVLSLSILSASFLFRFAPDITDYTARRLERTLERRVAELESFMDRVLEDRDSIWPEVDGLPGDMVIYRYVSDTLKSWYNQFTLDNDDIGRRMVVHHVTNLRYNMQSPLMDADTVLSYMNIGPVWYLVKSKDGPGNVRVIGGLQVINVSEGDSYNGVNDRLKVSDRFALYPISASGGSAVSVQGIPLMKLIQENHHVMALWPDIMAVWISLILLLAGVFFFLHSRGSLSRLFIALAADFIVCAAFFLMGYGMRSQYDVFSPTVYADGGLLYSLGAVLIVNTMLTTAAICFYMSRRSWVRYMHGGNTAVRKLLYSLSLLAGIAFIVTYGHLTFCSLIKNSNINLELYKVGSLSHNTFFVYLSYLGLLVSVIMLLQMFNPVVRDWPGFRYDLFSRRNRFAVSLLGAVYLLCVSSSLSLKREEGRAEIWANRLSVNRDLAFEMQLRSAEISIANDGLIPSLLAIDPDFGVITDRVRENYLYRIAQNYDVSVFMFRDTDTDENLFRLFNERMRNGTPLADNSRFMYSRSAVGRGQYTGFFTYYNEIAGVVHLLIAMESKSLSEGKGYDAVMNGAGRTVPVALPPYYSYAQYMDDKLVAFGGDYAYPTVFSGRLKSVSDSAGINHATIEQYVHFVTPVSENEYVVISEKVNEPTRYAVAAFVLLLMSYMGCGILTVGRPRKRMFENNFYKRRLNILLFVSLLATLVSMAVIIVLFIYRRNADSLEELMVGKINTIQSLVEAQSRQLRSPGDLSSPDFEAELTAISNYTGSDISLYSTDGKILVSTYPEIFESLAIGTRLDGEAYRRIIYGNKRYFIHKERIRDNVIYSMSAPIFDSRGNMQAIVNAPYTDGGIGFRDDALFHAAFIIVVFLILLIISRFVSGKMVDKMFRPLVDMGRKMQQSKDGGLAYIIYDRDDEIASLVDSYNRMVHDLSESGKQAAMVERNKAWNEMARQIAHEIKNPLTPIKLQIQRIMRLKQRQDPSWQEKFDSIAPVILGSIDQLTDTANEFSTFAKLYSEEPVDINLDMLASDQIALLDGRESITFRYIGLKDAMIKGPKPQLTRVFVNLLTNSVQAIEGLQHEQIASGESPVQGKIYVSVRNSSHDGFYDIVIEDNGPGVRDENRNRLFTPNFTTKSSGTGLGLAMCKSILDLCGAEIGYSTSFSLGGACFSIRYPKGQAQ